MVLWLLIGMIESGLKFIFGDEKRTDIACKKGDKQVNGKVFSEEAKADPTDQKNGKSSCTVAGGWR